MMAQKTNLPLVSVALPCYNQEKFIAEALDSVLSQDYENMEIIVSDDASTDKTGEILQEYGRQHPEKVFVEINKQNIGITRNMQSMRSRYKGKYVAWFAGDDVFLPGKISKQVWALEQFPEAVLCYHDIDVFDSNSGRTLYRFNDPLRGQKAYDGMVVSQMILNRCFTGGTSVMTRRDALPEHTHDDRLPIMADSLLWIKVAHKGPIIYLDEVLARYRRHGNNVTAQDPSYKEAEMFYRIISEEMPGCKEYCEEALTRTYVVFTLKYLSCGKVRQAFKALSKTFQSLRKNPLAIRGILAGFATALRKGISRIVLPQ